VARSGVWGRLSAPFSLPACHASSLSSDAGCLQRDEKSVDRARAMFSFDLSLPACCI